MNVNDPVEVIDSWLQSLHTTLWLDWDITDPRQRKQAAEFVNTMMDDIMRYATKVKGEARAYDAGRVGG